MTKPLFVLQTDVRDNIVYVGQGEDHWALMGKALKMETKDFHWIREELSIQVGEIMQVKARIRYRQVLQEAELLRGNDAYYLVFHQLQKGITPGQFAAIYLNDEVIASGVING